MCAPGAIQNVSRKKKPSHAKFHPGKCIILPNKDNNSQHAIQRVGFTKFSTVKQHYEECFILAKERI